MVVVLYFSYKILLLMSFFGQRSEYNVSLTLLLYCHVNENPPFRSKICCLGVSAKCTTLWRYFGLRPEGRTRAALIQGRQPLTKKFFRQRYISRCENAFILTLTSKSRILPTFLKRRQKLIITKLSWPFSHSFRLHYLQN